MPRLLRGSTGLATGRLPSSVDSASVLNRGIAALCGEPDGTTRAIEVGGYFDATDGKIETFRFENAPQEERDKTEPFRVPRFHRTLSGWVDLIVEAGLVIERLGEPRVSVEVAKAEPALEDTLVAPLFLHVRARKAADPPRKPGSYKLRRPRARPISDSSHYPRGARRAARPSCRRTAGIGASRPLRRIPAIVSFLNPQPALSLVGGNRSSCPNTDIRKERGVCAAGAAHVRMTGKSWSGKRRLCVPR